MLFFFYYKITKNLGKIFQKLKGGRASAVYEANFLRGSPMKVTGKIFDIIVPLSIYKRIMREKKLDYQVQVVRALYYF